MQIEASAAASAASTEAQTAIPFKSTAEPGGTSSDLAIGAGACLVFLLCAVITLRRFGTRGVRRPGAARAVEVLESTRLGDRTRLTLIRYRERELLVAHSEQTTTVLAGAPFPSTYEPPRTP